MDIKTKDCTWEVVTRHESRPSNFLLLYDHENKGRVFNIPIVQIPGLGRTLHLTKDMNDQMVEFSFQVKVES